MKKTITQNLKVFMTLCLLLFGVTSAVQADVISLDFEKELSSCTDWTSKNISSTTEFFRSGTHSGSTGGVTTAYVATANAIAFPQSMTCYYTKTSSNTNTSSYFVIQVSSDNSKWTDVAKGKTMNNVTKGTWEELTADLTAFSNVYVRVYYTGTSAVRVIDDITLNYESSSSTPLINASNVELAADATSGTISYSISNPVEGKSISASTTADWISNFEYTDNTVTFTTEANTTTAARTADITLKYDGATDKVVTITQKGKPFDSIESMYDAAVNYGSTATSSTIKFGNWVVSGVAGNNAYVTDGTNGFIIYAKDHGFKVGDILSGTVTCSLQLYNGSAELTGITSTTEGLTVTTGGIVTPKETTIDKLSGLNTGAVIVLKGVNYDGTNFTDGTNSIQPYKTFMTTLPTFDTSKKYNVTGVYIQYGTTKEIAPRSEDDIEEVTAAKYSITVAEGIKHGTVTPNVTSAIEGTKVTLTIEPETHYELSTLTITDSNGANVKYNEVDYSFLMPAYNVTVSATFAESAKYYVMYSSLGEEVGDGEEVYAGECIAKAPEVTAPEGWEFAGWTADRTYTTSTAVPTYFPAETPITQDTILYAVFSKTFGEGGEEAFVKVTSSLDDWTGNYLIVYETDSLAFNGSLETLDAVSNTVKVNIVDDKIAAVDAMKNIMFTVGVKSDDIYNLKSASGYYISGTTTVAKAGNGIKQAESDKDYEITFDYDETGGVLVYSQSSDQKMTLRYNKASDQKRFRFYKSGQQPVALYRYEGNSATIYSTTTVFDDYTRDGLTEGNLGTICLESDALVEGAQAYEVSSMTMNGDNISSITFSPVEKVEGGKGYLFVASGSELTAEYISEAKTEAENNGLVGSLEGTDVAEGKYIINSNKVKKCGTGCKIAANRAYIDPVKYVDELPAKGETITIELETPTSINELMQKVTAPGQWYNLNGQPVAQPTKGVFTKNGVKYIFK